MPIRVQVPGHGVVEFPDGTSQDVMKAALQKLTNPQGPAPSALDMLSGRRGFSSDEGKPKEPDTFRGGLIKGLKREFDATKAPGAQEMAHPSTAGDMASLLLPADLGAVRAINNDVINPVRNLVRGAAEGAANKQGLKKIPAVLKGMYETATDPAAPGQRAFARKPLAQQMESLPATPAPERGPLTPPTQPAANFNDLPLYKQMESMPEAGALPERGQAGPPITNLGKETAPVAPPPRLAGKAPSVEEAMQSELESMMGKGEQPQVSTSAPPIETAGAGPLKQSGKFGKSGSLGQPGGYTSGNPGLKLEDFKFGTAPNPEAERAIQTARESLAAERTPPVDAGVQGPDVGGLGTGVAPPPDAAPTSALNAGKPSITAKEAAANRDIGGSLLPNQDLIQKAIELRRLKGSRDAGSALFGTTNLSPAERKALVLKMAPGPSQVPLEAEDRINAAIRKAQMGGEDDPLLKAILAGLGGNMLMQQPSAEQ